MIIEHEAADHIIYSNATRFDFERAVKACQTLGVLHTWLERVVEGECINLYWKASGQPDELLLSYNTVEQELTEIY